MPRPIVYLTGAALALALAAVSPPALAAGQAVTLSDRSSAELVVGKAGRSGYRLTLRGQGEPSRPAVEARLAYEAAQLSIARKAQWFEAVAPKAADGWTPPAADPAGRRYNFRMENWRPSWRIRPSRDGAAPGAWEASIEVVLRQDRFDGANPLGFEPFTLDDFLREQVAATPPAAPPGAAATAPPNG